MSSEGEDRDTEEVERENAREEGIYRGRVEGWMEERAEYGNVIQMRQSSDVKWPGVGHYLVHP